MIDRQSWIEAAARSVPWDPPCSPTDLRALVAHLACRNRRDKTLDDLVIGIGQAGGRIVETWAGSDRSRRDRVLLIDQDSACHSRELDTLELPPVISRGLGDPGPGFTQRLALAQMELIAEHLAPARRTLLVLGLGGSTGYGVVPVVAAVGEALGLPIQVLAHLPNRLEGSKRRAKALQAANMLTQFATGMRVHEADGLLAEHDPDWADTLSIYNVFTVLNSRMSQEIVKNLEATQEPDPRQRR